ncbi:hypothetical protein [Cohnella hongkongensis]|uniref:Uncharacterized protein n=1 Tax=Cohnella hongkongensis TaxID=178337 RepID=A0ABV9FF56_9BACL
MPKINGDRKKRETGKKTASSASSSAVGDALLEMQQTGGNQHALSMIQTVPSDAGPSPGMFSIGSGGFQYQLPQASLIQEFSRDLTSGYAQAPSASDRERFPHLNREEGDRRLAELREPADRAALVKEARDQGRAHEYLRLTATSSRGRESALRLGRVQGTKKRGQQREQHFYDSGGKFTPYPREAEHLEGMTSPGTSTQKVWKALDAVNRGEAPPQGFESQERELMSVPVITNLSEVQRSPLMGAASNMEIANQAHTTGTPKSFEEAFGRSEEREVKKRKRKREKADSDEGDSKTKAFNFPGSISATGSGAVHQFQAVEDSLMRGELSEDAVRKRVRRAPEGSDVEEARRLAVGKQKALLGTFQDRLSMTDVSYAQGESVGADREMATLMRLRSGLRRNAMPQMGLLPSLRTLEKQTASSSSSTSSTSPAAKVPFEAFDSGHEVDDDEFVPRREELEESEDESALAELEEEEEEEDNSTIR